MATEDLNSLQGILAVRQRLLGFPIDCHNKGRDLGCELALLCNEDELFGELLTRVCDRDMFTKTENIMAELEFVLHASPENICDKYLEEYDESRPDPLCHFSDPYALIDSMLQILGEEAARYVNDYSDLQQMKLDTFTETLFATKQGW